MGNAQRWAPLLVAALLLIGAAVKYPSDFASAILAAGLVTLGVWLGDEVIRRHRERDKTQ